MYSWKFRVFLSVCILMLLIFKMYIHVTVCASVLLVWPVLDSEFVVSSSSGLWVTGSAWCLDAHSASPSLPSRDPASSERPTHHSPSLPSQSREGPTATPQGSNEQRNEASASGMEGWRPAINLHREINSRLQREEKTRRSHQAAHLTTRRLNQTPFVLHHAATFEQTLTYFYICSVKFIFCPILFAVFFCFFFISVWHHLFSILQIPAIKQERNEYLGFMMTYFRFFDVFHFKMIDVLSVKNYVRPDHHDTTWQVSYRPMNTTRPSPRI